MAERLTEEIRKSDQIDLTRKSDPAVVFISQMEESLKRLQEPTAWKMSHNRRRSRHGMKLATEQRKHQFLSTRDELERIKSKRFDEVKLLKNEKGKVVGLTIYP